MIERTDKWINYVEVLANLRDESPEIETYTSECWEKNIWTIATIVWVKAQIEIIDLLWNHEEIEMLYNKLMETWCTLEKAIIKLKIYIECVKMVLRNSELWITKKMLQDNIWNIEKLYNMLLRRVNKQ